MSKMKRNYKKIEETLNIINGIQSAQAPVDLYDKIIRRIENKRNNKNRFVSNRIIFRVACAFAGIIFLNFFILKSDLTKEIDTSNSETSEIKKIQNTYFSSTIYNY